MFQLSGFQVIEKIGSNETTSIYRLLRLVDNQSYIAKTTSDSYTGIDMTTAYKYEYEQLLRLQGKGVLEPYALEIAMDRPVLLFQDSGGTTLKQLLQTRRHTLRLAELLAVAVAVVDCIRELHHEQITLNELTPFYLMVSKDLSEVKLMDIRSCSMDKGSNSLAILTRRAPSILPYLSPELTGRTGMVPDYRSDFYSLGVILYEWFAKSLPFVHIGRCNVMGLEANDHGTVHRDGEPDEQDDQDEPDHFITVCPAADKRLFLWDEEKQEKTHVRGRAYWFNDHDYHGVDADPFFRYSIRVDGVFRPDFLETLRREHGGQRTPRVES